eukprot:11576435-Alexandrium_andersonii.AAC.1
MGGFDRGVDEWAKSADRCARSRRSFFPRQQQPHALSERCGQGSTPTAGRRRRNRRRLGS